MKIIRNQEKKAPKTNSKLTPNLVWKILIVDDDPEIHAVTRLTVDDLDFEGKSVQLLSAMSAKEAREILKKEPDIAVACIDVVMETEDAGLRLVNYIRNELNQKRIRLIIRTGQPGIAPEKYVIDHYDINDYKDKTEMTTERLYTTLRTALTAYQDLTTIDIDKQSLEKILTAAPNIYRVQPMEQFLESILKQVTTLYDVGEHSLISIFDKLSDISEENNITIRTGKFSPKEMDDYQINKIIKSCKLILQDKESINLLPKSSLLLPMVLYEQILGFIYFEEICSITDNDKYLLQIMTTQCTAALKNLMFYNSLKESNRQNERKNQFLGMAAHDLRNPLGVILGYGQMLQEEASEILNNEQLDYLNRIQNASNFTLNLVNNLLDIAKIESGNLDLELKKADLISIILDSISLNSFLMESKQIQFNLENDDNLPEMVLDKNKIQQVVNNIISNAIKYSHPQTKIRVRVIQKQHNNIVISITDEGQGIPESELNKLFQPFSKTSVKGTAGESSTGLGLLICRQIVEAHNGKIWVESKVGVGSTFYVLLPLVSEL